MSLTNLLKAIKSPDDLYGTYILFRNLGASWSEALKNAVDCVVLYRFVLP